MSVDMKTNARQSRRSTSSAKRPPNDAPPSSTVKSVVSPPAASSASVDTRLPARPMAFTAAANSRFESL
jgi:hypothetical protein